MIDNQNHPPLFKYMSATTARAVLKNCTLRWSTPGTLNDPYDAQFALHIEVDKEKAKGLALDKLWNAFYGDAPSAIGNIFGLIIHQVRHEFPKLSKSEFNKEFGEAFEESFSGVMRALPSVHRDTQAIMAKSKILCLTETSDGELMWAHYADHHKGIVLRFRSVPGLDSPWRLARRVSYLENMPRLLDEEFLSDIWAGHGSITPELVMDRITYTKSAAWKYENEWRLCSGHGRKADALFEDIPFHPLELDGVIFGCRVSEINRKEIIGALSVNYPHVELMQAHKAEKEFRLEIRPLSALFESAHPSEVASSK